MYEREEMGITKARIAVELKEFKRVSEKLGALCDQLQEQCEDVYGHDFGPDDESSFCSHCEMLNDSLLAEAEEEYDELARRN
jgi:hypothetical protein